MKFSENRSDDWYKKYRKIHYTSKTLCFESGWVEVHTKWKILKQSTSATKLYLSKCTLLLETCAITCNDGLKMSLGFKCSVYRLSSLGLSDAGWSLSRLKRKITHWYKCIHLHWVCIQARSNSDNYPACSCSAESRVVSGDRTHSHLESIWDIIQVADRNPRCKWCGSTQVIRMEEELVINTDLHHTAVRHTLWNTNTCLVPRISHLHMTSCTQLWRTMDPKCKPVQT